MELIITANRNRVLTKDYPVKTIWLFYIDFLIQLTIKESEHSFNINTNYRLMIKPKLLL